MSGASFGPTLQGLADNTGSTLAQISSLFVIRSLGYLLGSLNAGRVYDLVKKGHWIMALAVLGIAGMMALSPTASSLFFLSVILFTMGFSEGTLDVGSNTLIAWLHGSRVPPFMNGLHAFFGIGTTVAPLIVAWALASTGKISMAYWLLAVLILPAGLILPFLPSPSATSSKNEYSESRPAIPMLVFLASTIFFLYVGAEVGFAGWIYTYTTKLGLALPAAAASINAAFWASFTVGRLASIPLAARFKPNTILWTDLCGSGMGLLLIILYPQNLSLLWVGTIATGLFMASIFPTILNDAQRRMSVSSKTTSWFFVGASLGGMLIPWFMGQIIGPMGPRSAMVAVFITILAAAGVFVGLNEAQQRISPAPLSHK